MRLSDWLILFLCSLMFKPVPAELGSCSQDNDPGKNSPLNVGSAAEAASEVIVPALQSVFSSVGLERPTQRVPIIYVGEGKKLDASVTLAVDDKGRALFGEH
jgi:hypothetical protein